MSAPPGRPVPAAPAPGADNVPWRELVGTVGADIAGPLSEALERIHKLISTGRIDESELRALRDAVDEARQVGMTAQRLTRFGSRRVRVSHERMALTDLLGEVMRHRAREADVRGLPLQCLGGAPMQAADVLADASMLFSLLNTLVDWALRHADSCIELSVRLKTWPANAVLGCQFLVKPRPDADGQPAADLDSLTWRLLEQLALTMDLSLQRELDRDQVRLSLEFPRTANASMEGVSSFELNDQGSAGGPNSMPLVGSHVLIVASRRDVRVAMRDAILHMGLLIDLVSSVEEAVDFCRDTLPHALVYEGILEGERLAQLRTEIWAEVPSLAFIEMVEEGQGFTMSDQSTAHVARVAKSSLEESLPSVLLFELSKGL